MSRNLIPPPCNVNESFKTRQAIIGVLRSPFIVIIFGYYVDGKRRVLIYEYMHNGSLQEALFEKETMIKDEAEVLQALEQREKQEEISWKQKSHIQWLKGGNNISFFHKSMFQHCHHNRIASLKGVDGRRQESHQEISPELNQFFQNIMAKPQIDKRRAIQQTTTYASISHVVAQNSPVKFSFNFSNIFLFPSLFGCSHLLLRLLEGFCLMILGIFKPFMEWIFPVSKVIMRGKMMSMVIQQFQLFYPMAKKIILRTY